MSLDSMGGIDQTFIVRNETREINEQIQNKKELLTDRVKLYVDPNTQDLRWEVKNNNEFSEPVFTENNNPNEVEVDLTGEGNGKLILGVTEAGTFQVLPTQSEETFQYPEGITDVVDLNSGKWIVKPDNQGITLKSAEVSK